MNKKFVAVASFFAVGAGLVAVPFVSAQVANSNQGKFVSILAENLGVEESTVQTAVDSTRETMHSEMEAQRAEDISTAVSDGKITQRQADIQNAIHEIMEAKRENGDFQNGRPADFEEVKDMTQDERQAFMQEKRAEIDATLVTELNTKGLNTNLEEVTATREALKDAGIAGPKGGKGMGRGGMRR